MFGKEISQFAAKKLGMPDDYELFYQSVQAAHIYDSEDLAMTLEGLNPNNELDLSIEETIENEIVHIELPEGLRIVGLRCPKTQDQHFGIVDFTAFHS